MISYIIPIIILLLVLSFIVYKISNKPSSLIQDFSFTKSKKVYHSIEDKYNEEKAIKQIEIDKLLEKINAKGIESLSNKEKLRLEELSK